MTDRQRKMIEAYLPGEPDPTLEFGEYFMLDSADRVIRVRATEMAYYGRSDEEIRRPVRPNGTGVFNAPGGVTGMDGWVFMSFLYDNKEDCKHNTHAWYHDWENLRLLQQEERAAR